MRKISPRHDENMVTDFHRECTNCKKRIHYKDSSRRNKATKWNSVCKSCAYKSRSEKITGTTWKWKREESRKLASESHKNSAIWIASMNTPEYKQRQRETKLGEKNVRYGKPHTNEYKRTHSERAKLWWQDPKNSEKLSGRKWTDEQRERYVLAFSTPENRKRLRESRLAQIRDSGMIPSFNRAACQFFDILNSKLKWNGQHALKDSEREIIGYSVDYYNPELNLVIEWDEESHFKQKSTIEKDLRRQERILDTGVKFYRIRQKTEIVTKVDNFADNYLTQIQEILNEHSKNKTTTA